MKFSTTILCFILFCGCSTQYKKTISNEDSLSLESKCPGLYLQVKKNWRKHKGQLCYKFDWELIKFLKNSQNESCLGNFSTEDIIQYFGEPTELLYASILPKEKVLTLKEDALVYKADEDKNCVIPEYSVSFYFDTSTKKIISFGYLQMTLD
jgi:hypothetical protein